VRWAVASCQPSAQQREKLHLVSTPSFLSLSHCVNSLDAQLGQLEASLQAADASTRALLGQCTGKWMHGADAAPPQQPQATTGEDAASQEPVAGSSSGARAQGSLDAASSGSTSSGSEQPSADSSSRRDDAGGGDAAKASSSSHVRVVEGEQPHAESEQR
jgi:hypothetical protein